MTGFDFPCQFANCADGIGRVLAVLTVKPSIFGKASVALATQGCARRSD
jgi:hypothetical protein